MKRSVCGAVLLAVVVAGCSGGSAKDNAKDDASVEPDADVSSQPGAAARPALTLADATSWERVQSTCEAWSPAQANQVVELKELSVECLARAPRDFVTVFEFPASATSPFDEDWLDVSKKWRSIGGHEVRRLAEGGLASVSSRYVGAIVCADCDVVVVVMGQDPDVVNGHLDSAQQSGS